MKSLLRYVRGSRVGALSLEIEESVVPSLGVEAEYWLVGWFLFQRLKKRLNNLHPSPQGRKECEVKKKVIFKFNAERTNVINQPEYTKQQWDLEMAHDAMIERQEKEEAELIDAVTSASWLIWSMEHQAFWGPNECGYVREWKEAGRYPFLKALAIVENANYRTGKNPREAMIMENTAHAKPETPLDRIQKEMERRSIP